MKYTYTYERMATESFSFLDCVKNEKEGLPHENQMFFVAAVNRDQRTGYTCSSLFSKRLNFSRIHVGSKESVTTAVAMCGPHHARLPSKIWMTSMLSNQNWFAWGRWEFPPPGVAHVAWVVPLLPSILLASPSTLFYALIPPQRRSLNTTAVHRCQPQRRTPHFLTPQQHPLALPLSFSRRPQAHHLGGGSPAHLLRPNPRPASTFFGDLLGNGNGNGNGNTWVAAGIHGGSGGAASVGLPSSTVYGGGEAAAPLPILSRRGGVGYGGNQAPVPRAGRVLGASGNGRSFLDGSSCVAQENDRPAVRAFLPSPANGDPSGSGGGGGSGGGFGGGGGGSFRGSLPTGPLREGELKWVIDIFDEVRRYLARLWFSVLECALSFHTSPKIRSTHLYM